MLSEVLASEKFSKAVGEAGDVAGGTGRLAGASLGAATRVTPAVHEPS